MTADFRQSCSCRSSFCPDDASGKAVHTAAHGLHLSAGSLPQELPKYI